MSDDFESLFGDEPEAPAPTPAPAQSLENIITAMDTNQFSAVVNAVSAEYQRRAGPPNLGAMTAAEFEAYKRSMGL